MLFLILSQAATKIDVVLYYFVSALNTLSMQVHNLKIPYQQFWTYKGQLISKCAFVVTKLTKKPTKFL